MKVTVGAGAIVGVTDSVGVGVTVGAKAAEGVKVDMGGGVEVTAIATLTVATAERALAPTVA